MKCHQCGAAIELSTKEAVACRFCGAANAPKPTEVPVPVPMNVVHNVVQVMGPAGEAEQRCPHCRKRLVGAEVEGATLFGCPGCGGIWIDNASAKRVLEAPTQTFAVLAQRAAKNARGGVRLPRPTCAACPATLDKVRVHGIELDVCIDHGTWFDALELSRLTAVLRGEAVTGVAVPPDQPTTCAGCGRGYAAGQLNITDIGPACDACWRSKQAALISRADDQRHASAAGAVLLGVAAVMLGAATARPRS